MQRVGREATFHVMAKPVGPLCNLDCGYCYYLSKQLLYPSSSFRMDAALLERYVGELFASHGAGEVIVAWQGGEPTLAGLAFFEHAVALVEKYRRPGQRAVHCIQTNGVRVDRTWAQFFKRHGFLVGVSLDGPPALHDAYRVDKQGSGTFTSVLRGIAALKSAGVEWNVLTTLHAANAPHPRHVYRFLRDRLGARHIQFIPIVEREAPSAAIPGTVKTGARTHRELYSQHGDRVGARSISAEAYGKFLIEVFDEWVVRDVGRVSVQAFDAAFAAWLDLPPPVCVFAPTCPPAVALEHNGDVYACDHYVQPGYRLGNLMRSPMRSLIDGPAHREFRDAKRDTLPAQCRTCEFLFACHGGCPKDRLVATAEEARPLNHLCGGYRAFFRHIDPTLRVVRNLVQAGRPATDIMRLKRDGRVAPSAP